MESHQPWPAFNIQNQLAEYQKRSYISNQVPDTHFFHWISTHTHTHKTTATNSILQQNFFFFFFAQTGGNKKQPKVKTTHVDRFWIWLMNAVITVLYRWCKLKLHHNSRRQTCHKFKGQLFWHKRFCASWTGSQWNNLYMDRWSVGQFGCKWDFFSPCRWDKNWTSKTSRHDALVPILVFTRSQENQVLSARQLMREPNYHLHLYASVHLCVHRCVHR